MRLQASDAPAPWVLCFFNGERFDDATEADEEDGSLLALVETHDGVTTERRVGDVRLALKPDAPAWVVDWWNEVRQ